MNFLTLQSQSPQRVTGPATKRVVSAILLFAGTLIFGMFSASAFAKSTVVYGFDGTGKNIKGGAKTNVYYFLKGHQKANRGSKSVYVGGVGSAPGAGLFNIPGKITGVGGRARVNEMYDQLVKNFKAGRKGIVIVGFSRGAALSREFANVIYERGDPLKYRKGKKPRGKAPKIKFMGLFDTVYSFGSPFGKEDIGYRKAIPKNVVAVAHATAGLEKRNTFGLWSIHFKKKYLYKTTGSVRKGNYRSERRYKAGHDDVGGAEKYNYYGYAPLMYIISQAKKAGVKVTKPPKRLFRKKRGQKPSGHGIGKRQIYFPDPNESKKAKPKRVAAKVVGKAKPGGCAGKQIYLSQGSCYSCPKGYRRYSPTRKMTHPKACTQRGWGSKTKKAKYAWEYNGCRKGEFKHKGSCKKCPSGTKRIHAAGLDTGYCSVKR